MTKYINDIAKLWEKYQSIEYCKRGVPDNFKYINVYPIVGIKVHNYVLLLVNFQWQETYKWTKKPNFWWWS